jgi:hypothetical protein
VLGAVVGVLVGPVAGVVVGVAPGVVPPVQATPLRVNPAGAGLLPVQLPLKPNEALPFVASAPFQPVLDAVTVSPEEAIEAFQPCVTRCPAGKVQPICQLSTGSPRFCTATTAVKPVDHWLPTVYVTWHPVVAAPAAVAVARPAAASTVATPASHACRRLLRKPGKRAMEIRSGMA